MTPSVLPVKRCNAHLGERLLAIYLSGSIMYGDALPGVSDVDWWTICRDEPTEADQTFCDELKRLMPERFPVVAEFWVNLLL